MVFHNQVEELVIIKEIDKLDNKGTVDDLEYKGFHRDSAKDVVTDPAVRRHLVLEDELDCDGHPISVPRCTHNKAKTTTAKLVAERVAGAEDWVQRAVSEVASRDRLGNRLRRASVHHRRCHGWLDHITEQRW